MSESASEAYWSRFSWPVTTQSDASAFSRLCLDWAQSWVVLHSLVCAHACNDTVKKPSSLRGVLEPLDDKAFRTCDSNKDGSIDQAEVRMGTFRHTHARTHVCTPACAHVCTSVPLIWPFRMCTCQRNSSDQQDRCSRRRIRVCAMC